MNSEGMVRYGRRARLGALDGEAGAGEAAGAAVERSPARLHPRRDHVEAVGRRSTNEWSGCERTVMDAGAPSPAMLSLQLPPSHRWSPRAAAPGRPTPPALRRAPPPRPSPPTSQTVSPRPPSHSRAPFSAVSIATASLRAPPRPLRLPSAAAPTRRRDATCLCLSVSGPAGACYMFDQMLTYRWASFIAQTKGRLGVVLCLLYACNLINGSWFIFTSRSNSR